MNSDLIGMYFLSLIVMTIVSIVMYIWIAVPMYLGIGYLLKAAEETMTFDDHNMDAPSLDSGVTVERVYRNSDLDF